MSAATVVVESDVHGGSMITARLAAEQGRDVFAVPGRIDSRPSRGCNALIRDGATLATSAEDIIDELRSTGQVELDFSPAERPEEPAPEKPSAALPLSEDESRVLRCMDSSRVSYADEISERSGMAVQKCLAVLLMLEIRKIVKNPTAAGFCDFCGEGAEGFRRAGGRNMGEPAMRALGYKGARSFRVRVLHPHQRKVFFAFYFGKCPAGFAFCFAEALPKGVLFCGCGMCGV